MAKAKPKKPKRPKVITSVRQIRKKDKAPKGYLTGKKASSGRPGDKTFVGPLAPKGRKKTTTNVKKKG